MSVTINAESINVKEGETPVLFVLTIPDTVSAAGMERVKESWNALWTSVGSPPPAPVVFLTASCRLELLKREDCRPEILNKSL